MKSFKKIALAMVAAVAMGSLATPASAAPMVVTSVKKNTGTIASPTWTAQTAGTAATTPITIPVPTDNSVDSLDVVEFVVTVDTGTTVSVSATNANVVSAFVALVISAVMLDVFAKMKIPTTATPAPAASPATAAKPLPPVPPPDQPATAPAQPAQAAQQPTQAAPAAKSGKPVIKQPSVANNRTAGVRQQGGTFTYNPLAEDAEKLAELEAAMKQAQQITRAIKYDDSTTEIIVKIQELAQRTGIDPRSVKYAINDVYEAKSALESAVYGLDELFKDAYQEAKWKHDDEQEGLSEEEKKPRTAKALIYQTDMYGAKGYYAECKEPGCDWKSKSYDRIKQAQDSAKKHGQEHFKVTETNSTGMGGGTAGIGGGAGLGIEKSPIEKVLEKPFESLSEDAMADQFYDEFSKSSFKPDSPLYLDNLKGVKDFLTSKNLPQDKLKFLLRKLVQKIKPEMESSIMRGIQSEYKEFPTQRKIVFDKENPPDLYYLYQQFIQRMLNPENTVEPNDWIDKVNKHYGLNYTWKDYQKRGHNDQTNNWQKIIDKYILKK